MSHLEQQALRRILGEESGPQEVARAAKHILSCAPCRAVAGTVLEELRAGRPKLRGEGPLQVVFDVIDQERQWGLDSLAALAEWSELRRLSQRSQRDRVRMSKACHTLAFFHLVLEELRKEPSWEEAEFLAGLALLSVEAMRQRRQITHLAFSDSQAEVWTAVANARRRAAEWQRAHQALANAERHLKEGSGEPRLKAGLLSILGSTLADEGHVSEALDALECCKTIYEGLSEWALLARTLVQMANVLAGTEPARGLEVLDRAVPLIPIGDSGLTLSSEMVRVECLIESNKPSEALRVFQRAAPLLAASS